MTGISALAQHHATDVTMLSKPSRLGLSKEPCSPSQSDPPDPSSPQASGTQPATPHQVHGGPVISTTPARLVQCMAQGLTWALYPRGAGSTFPLVGSSRARSGAPGRARELCAQAMA